MPIAAKQCLDIKWCQEYVRAKSRLASFTNPFAAVSRPCNATKTLALGSDWLLWQNVPTKCNYLPKCLKAVLGSLLPSRKEGEFLASSSTLVHQHQGMQSVSPKECILHLTWNICAFQRSAAQVFQRKTNSWLSTRETWSVSRHLVVSSINLHSQSQHSNFPASIALWTCHRLTGQIYGLYWMSSDGMLSMKKFSCARDWACFLMSPHPTKLNK